MRLSSINATFSEVSDPFSSSSPRFLKGLFAFCKINWFYNKLMNLITNEILSLTWMMQMWTDGCSILSQHLWVWPQCLAPSLRWYTHPDTQKIFKILTALFFYAINLVPTIKDMFHGTVHRCNRIFSLHNTSISSLAFSRGASMTFLRLKFTASTSNLWPVISVKRCQCRDIIA